VILGNLTNFRLDFGVALGDLGQSRVDFGVALGDFRGFNSFQGGFWGGFG